MLVLTRRLHESILIGENIEIQIVQVRGSGDQAVVRLGISAPPDVRVLRKEVYDEVVAANRQAVRATQALPPGLLAAVKEKEKEKEKEQQAPTGRDGAP